MSGWTVAGMGPDSRELGGIDYVDGAIVASESTRLIKGGGGSSPQLPEEPDDGLAHPNDRPWEALRGMFLDNKINLLFGFLPFAYWSHAAGWPDSSVFVLTFLTMVPLASMLGIFTEELAAHTNDVIGGLINATFGNAVELVVAVQALLHNDFLVVQSSLIGSVFSNLLLVLGMCFFCGGMCYPEQNFVSQGAVVFMAMLGVSGLTLVLPEFFGDNDEEDLTISRIGAVLLVLLYLQLMYFQLSSHSHLFEGDDDTVALIPLSWALIGMIVVTAMVTILSDWLVGSIGGFCIQFNLSHSFVGLVILPVVGDAVEHMSAISVAMKNKMDLALGIALGSSAQIAVFVLPVVVLIGWCTGRDMSLRFPSMQVYLYLLSIFIVSLVLSNSKSNWLEGSLLIFTYTLVAVGVYFEKDDAL
ncbi:hypothetical protein ACHAW5_001342 [Stephanodiscus triporus]|uniref:Sodium/calcium exchanger membrane region domain-containing protein n=1 Tax=Stephanodiscus triporus TaxID=2934178 RepID=A0ABD3NYB1_9STRA